MILSATTQQILDELEMITGKPVSLVPNSTLSVSTTIKAARGSAPAHFLSYKPGIQGLDYAVAYQCSFLLRIYQVPLQERLDFVGKEDGRDSVRRALAGPMLKIKFNTTPSVRLADEAVQITRVSTSMM